MKGEAQAPVWTTSRHAPRNGSSSRLLGQEDTAYVFIVTLQQVVLFITLASLRVLSGKFERLTAVMIKAL
jgi:hypothetical protein